MCHYHEPRKNIILESLNNYQEVKEQWNKYKLHDDRLDIFLDVANKLEGKYYDRMMAYTILGQIKTPYEAEIDSI